MDQDDLNSLALVAWKEARGDGQIAMDAVMHVILNRVGAVGFPHTLHDVIFQKNAFSSMTVPTDKEFNLQPTPGDPQFAFCMLTARMAQTDPDPTLGAKYYANLAHVTSGWFMNHILNNPTEHPQTAVIGKQTFYR